MLVKAQAAQTLMMAVVCSHSPVGFYLFKIYYGRFDNRVEITLIL